MTVRVRLLLLALAAAPLVLAACSNLPQATAGAASAYQVNLAQSEMHFVSTKAGLSGVGGVSEVQVFKRFSGGLTPDGRVSFDVDLASVDTGIGIRDERLRTMLFNVQLTPSARFVAQLDPAAMLALSASPTASPTHDLNLKGTLTLVGQTRPVEAKLRLTRLASGALQVSTLRPIVVDANQFGLKAGVEALRESVGLNFLASVAPVSFTLHLDPQR